MENNYKHFNLGFNQQKKFSLKFIFMQNNVKSCKINYSKPLLYKDFLNPVVKINYFNVK